VPIMTTPRCVFLIQFIYLLTSEFCVVLFPLIPKTWTNPTI